VPLSPTGRSGPLRFHECPQCGRAFTERPDGPLVERWLGPLSAALYSVIFEPRPQEPGCVRRVAGQLGHLDTQPVADVLGPMRAGEDDLREFLRLLADELERGSGG